MSYEKTVKKLREACRIDDSEFFRCQLTGKTCRMVYPHHMIKRSQGGSDDESNLIMVDTFVHGAYHDGERVFSKHIEAIGLKNKAKNLYKIMDGKLAKDKNVL